MSTVDDLRNSLETLAGNTDNEATSLTTTNQAISDQATAMDSELSSSQSGRDVAEAFSAAVTAVEEAVAKLGEASQKARDYAEALVNN